jgi:hypothetical protein
MAKDYNLSPQERLKLSLSYIERYRDMYTWDKDMVLTENDLNFWAWEQFDELVKSAPDIALDVILEVLAHTDNDDVLDNLSAGPLEDIIRLHGQLMIDRIEHEAGENEKFKDLLCGVWPVGSPEIWERVQRLSGS